MRHQAVPHPEDAVEISYRALAKAVFDFISVGELYAATMAKEAMIRSLGYNLTTIWHETHGGITGAGLTESNVEPFNRYHADR